MHRMATPPLLKRLNEETVLDTIRTGAPISRAEIARRAGISKPTVSLALQALLDAGLVREAPRRPAGPTYGAIYFEPVAEASLVRAAGLSPALVDEIVVGIPGVVEPESGVVRLATNIPGLDGRRYGAELEARLGVRVTLENDVNLAALGERRQGIARGVDDFM